MWKRALSKFVDIHPQIQEAIAYAKPVVALETTLVTHGFPYPTNVELSSSLEEIVSSTGAVPATIGVLNGRVKIGMQKAQIEQLVDRSNLEKQPVKISRRDIAPAIVSKANGGTTCSATLIFAALAGIKVFATGGLGGVHRGGQLSMDISADLFELSRCPVGLVSSGIKSILDIGRTLEYLETLGVPVLTYGKTREFPAFFSRRSGFEVPWNVDNPSDAAQILYTQEQLAMNNGVLFAVPIPEEHEADGSIIQAAINQAVAESEEKAITGSAATPWLLTRISELTKGNSLAANVALLKNTALVGGQIAVEYAKLNTSYNHSPATIPIPNDANVYPHPADLIVIGCSAVDVSARFEVDHLLSAGSTTPGTVVLTYGGVARNIAEASHRLLSDSARSDSVLLVSPIGYDHFGSMLKDQCRMLGMRTDGLIQADRKTAVCNLILDHQGNLIHGVADMSIVSEIEGSTLVQHISKHSPRVVALDGNLSPAAIQTVVSYCADHGIFVFFEPTSVTKSIAIMPAIASRFEEDGTSSPIEFTSPNTSELKRMYTAFQDDPFDLMSSQRWWKVMDNFALQPHFRDELAQLTKLPVDDTDPSKGTLSFLEKEGIPQMALKLLPFFRNLIIKCGEQGVLLVSRGSQNPNRKASALVSPSSRKRHIFVEGKSGEAVYVRHFPPLNAIEIVNVTGVGDTLVGSLLAGLIRDNSLDVLIDQAQQAAIHTLASPHAVSPMLSQMKI